MLRRGILHKWLSKQVSKFGLLNRRAVNSANIITNYVGVICCASPNIYGSRYIKVEVVAEYLFLGLKANLEMFLSIPRPARNFLQVNK